MEGERGESRGDITGGKEREGEKNEFKPINFILL